MRKTFTLIAFAFLGLGLQAQLLRSDLPDVGETQVYRKADTTGMSAGPGGMSQTWNFGSLVPLGAVSTNNYIAPSVHPQGSFYPSANLCYKPGNDDFKFYEASADSFNLIGDKSVANTRATYTDGAALYRFPQAFGVANVDSLHGTYPDGFISSVSRKGWYQTIFDGSGTLTTPFATYPSVKRVEITASMADSSWTGAANGTVDLTRYEWYASTQTMPVLIIHFQQVILNGGNPTTTHEIWYADPNAVSTTEANFANLDIYPNPSNGNSHLTYRLESDDNILVELVSVVGQRVSIVTNGAQAAGSHSLDLGTQDLAKGVYLVRMTSSHGTVVRKLALN